MTTEEETTTSTLAHAREGWNEPLPRAIPRATYFPAATAFGVGLFMWGFVTSPVVFAVGSLTLVVALWGWIGEMRRDP